MKWWREKDYSPQAAHPAGRADARCLTAFDPNLRSKLLILLQVLLTGFIDWLEEECSMRWWREKDSNLRSR